MKNNMQTNAQQSALIRFYNGVVAIALKEIRRLDLHWTGDEVKYYDAIKIIADQNKIELPDFVKTVIADKTKKSNRFY